MLSLYINSNKDINKVNILTDVSTGSTRVGSLAHRLAVAIFHRYSSVYMSLRHIDTLTSRLLNTEFTSFPRDC